MIYIGTVFILFSLSACAAETRLTLLFHYENQHIRLKWGKYVEC